MPQTDGWKPGPPPLDTPGRYDLMNRHGWRDAITVRETDVSFGNGSKRISDVDLSWVVMHYFIPDPPETETNAT